MLVCKPPIRETRRSTMPTPSGATDCHTAHALIEAKRDQVLWGSDWPPVDRFGDIADADLIEQLALWAPDPGVLRKSFVDNPAGHYAL